MGHRDRKKYIKILGYVLETWSVLWTGLINDIDNPFQCPPVILVGLRSVVMTKCSDQPFRWCNLTEQSYEGGGGDDSSKSNLIRYKTKLYLHITLWGVYIVEEWLNGHPFDGKFSRALCLMILAALIYIPGQTKVRYLHQMVVADKDITSCKVPVNELLLWQVFLKRVRNIVKWNCFYGKKV